MLDISGDDYSSSRPHTAMLAEEASADKNLTSTSPQKPGIPSEMAPSLPRHSTSHRTHAADISAAAVTSLVYHSTDFAVSPISDDIKVLHKFMRIYFNVSSLSLFLGLYLDILCTNSHSIQSNFQL